MAKTEEYTMLVWSLDPIQLSLAKSSGHKRILLSWSLKPEDLCWQGLGDMKTHMSCLEKERAAAAARKAAGVSSPAVESRLPGYMRQTAASVAMQKACHASIFIASITCLLCGLHTVQRAVKSMPLKHQRMHSHVRTE